MGRLICCLGNQQWDIPKLRELLEEVHPSNQSFEGYNVEHEFPSTGLTASYLTVAEFLIVRAVL